MFSIQPINAIPNYWEKYPEWWTPIGEGIYDDNILHMYQGFIAGDLWGNGTPACVGAYSHMQEGLWLHMKNSSQQWHRTPLHPDFFGIGFYTMKIAIGYDWDLDGYLELMTGNDVVKYPQGVNESSFASAIWVDMTKQGLGPDRVIVHPLIWGEWGETLGGGVLPIPTDPAFVNLTNSLPGALITTGANNESRVFFLEQPAIGFENVDYRYNSSTTQMEEPYNDPAFYVKRLYENVGGGMYRELLWTRDDYPLLGASACIGCWPITIDINDDGYLDLAVTAHYVNKSGELLRSQVEFYVRTPDDHTHEYTYNKTQTLSYTTFGLTVGHAINLDGNVSTGHNGREAIVMPLSSGYRPEWGSSETYYPPGPVVFKRTGSEFEIVPLIGASESWTDYPYFGTSWLSEVIDVNDDGFEDTIMSLVSSKGSSVYVFINPNTPNGSVGGFVYNDDYAKLVLQDQALSHTCQLCDADMDGNQDFIISSVVLNNYGTEGNAAKFAYYLNLSQDWSQFSSYHPIHPEIIGYKIVLEVTIITICIEIVIVIRRYRRKR